MKNNTEILPDIREPAIVEMEKFSEMLYRFKGTVEKIDANSKATCQILLNYSSMAKDAFDSVTEIKKKFCEPHKKFISMVSTAAKDLEDVKDFIQKHIAEKIYSFQRDEIERSAQVTEEMLKLQQEAGIELGVEMGEPVTTIRSANGSVVNKTKTVFELKDISLVPREFLCLDEKKVKLALAMGVKEIPGIEVKEETTVVLRRK